LFRTEQEALTGNNYTYLRLFHETLILSQRYLRRARKLTEIGDDENVDAEQRIEAHTVAAELERAVHDMSYFAPSYLRTQGLLPDPKSGNGHPRLQLSRIDKTVEEKDEYEKQRLDAAAEYRRQYIQQQ
jgi:hypothetical protein